MSLPDQLEALQRKAAADLTLVHDEAGLDGFRVQYLGKKGGLTLLSAAMRDLGPAEKPAAGKALNEARNFIQSAIDGRSAALAAERDAKAASELDVTLPGRPMRTGSIHPLTQLQDEAVDLLRRAGFAVAEGPEIETEWFCFDALNTPPDHPARNEKDTFYMPDGRLLRTHTSTVQIRAMCAAKELPLRITAPGSAYRRDEIDATHLSVFHQLEGLYVAEGVNLGDLKGVLEFFFRGMFGDETEIRFRPHFFPFTEPSYEIDVKLIAPGKEARWIEIAGCGMVDPAVFEAVSAERGDDLLTREGVSGFAFGMGLERLAMIRWGVPDIRLFMENDQRFLKQFDR